MTEGEKLAYLAGIIDGEACVRIGKKKIGKHGGNLTPGYCLSVNVVSVDEILINWLADNFKGISGPRGGKSKERWRNVYLWVIAGYDAYKLLKKTEAFLVIKKEQVKVAVKFWDETQRNGNTGRGRKPLWKVERQEKYFQELKALHHEIKGANSTDAGGEKHNEDGEAWCNLRSWMKI